MRTIRRVGGLAVAGFLLTSFVGGPAASAQTTEQQSAETYVGSATGKALVLTLAGSGVSAGNSSAKVDSLLNAAATGQGTLAVGQVGALPIGGTKLVTAAVQGEGVNTPAKECANPAIPAQLAALNTLLTVGIACGTATAKVAGGLPQ